MTVKQILIADDDQDLLQLLSVRCSQLGLDVITCSDAMDALANADYYAPDIALLDVRMPGGNGVSVTEMMATDERLSHTSVIVMTGDPNEKIQQRCQEIDAQLIKKDQEIWTRLEPLLKALLEDEAEHQAFPRADLFDTRSVPATETQSSRLPTLTD